MKKNQLNIFFIHLVVVALRWRVGGGRGWGVGVVWGIELNIPAKNAADLLLIFGENILEKILVKMP